MVTEERERAQLYLELMALEQEKDRLNARRIVILNMLKTMSVISGPPFSYSDAVHRAYEKTEAELDDEEETRRDIEAEEELGIY